MRILPCGDHAVMLDCATLDEALGWYAALHELADAVVGARTVLLRGEPAGLRDLVRATEPQSAVITASDTVDVPVVYDGPDLDEVARLTGLTTAGVVDAHTQTSWTTAFGGFAPGFSYLVDGDPRLQVPRRPSPRTAVPAGAVGLAGEFSGVYPRASPGGWQLIGRTDLPVWDSSRVPAALLLPGTIVRFRVRS